MRSHPGYSLAQEKFGNVVQGNITRIDMATKERLGELVFNHMKRGKRDNLISSYDYLKGAYKDNRAKLILEVEDDTERDDGYKLHLWKVRVNIRKISLLGEECNEGTGYPGVLGNPYLEGFQDWKGSEIMGR